MNTNPVETAAHHVKDAPTIVLPFQVEIALPKVFGFQLTKFMVLEVVAALLMVLIFVPLGRKLADGKPPKGRLWNLLEVMILFLRNEVVRPAIGRHDADRFLPLILTLFSINVTAPLAVMAFLAGTLAGMKKYGAIGFWRGLCPPMDLPPVLSILLVPMVLVLETVGMLIRYSVLAVRLLANMFGGHLVLAMIVGFIPAMAGSLLWYGVAPLAVFGGTAISMLELFVAFLQAYIFAFLAALFIGMSVHQH